MGEVFRTMNEFINPFYPGRNKKLKLKPISASVSETSITTESYNKNDVQISATANRAEIRVFIGSSTEASGYAGIINDILNDDIKINNRPLRSNTWRDIFMGGLVVSVTTLDTLMQLFKNYNFGVFLFMPDDITTSRNKEQSSVRDNVLFEYSLFLGLKGVHNCCMVFPGDDIKTKKTSDLDGLNGVAIDRLLELINGNDEINNNMQSFNYNRSRLYYLLENFMIIIKRGDKLWQKNKFFLALNI